MIYEKTKPRNRFGQQLDVNALAAPPGHSLQTNLVELLRGIEDMLGLVELGIYTPWARRDGDLAWTEIHKPDTNVAVFSIDDAQLNRATNELFGQPLPFVAVLTPLMHPMLIAKNASLLTRYEFFETQAVYNQTDSNEPPQIQFLHWYRVRDLGASGGGTMPMSTVAVALGGRLVFGQQVPVESTTSREAPFMPFESALDAQFGGSPVPSLPEIPPLPPFPGGGNPMPVPPPQSPAPPAQPAPAPAPPSAPIPKPGTTAPQAAQVDAMGLLLVGAAAAAGVVLIGKAFK